MKKQINGIIILRDMNTGLSGTKPNGWLHSLLASSQFRIIRQGFGRGSETLLIIEPLWVLTATTLVYFSYLFQWGAFLPWIGLAMAFLSFPLLRVRHGYLKLSTPLDIPVALYLVGALVGLIVSPKLGLSLGAFQCILAASLFYYSWVNYPRLATITKWLIPLGILPVLVWVIYASGEWRQALVANDPLKCAHGLALYLLIITAILTGVAIFSKGTAAKVIGGLVCIAILVAIVLLLKNSISSLLAGQSIDGRLPFWGTTIDLIGDSPFTGLGLGCWALVYHGAEIITPPTHVHNAYLEMYSNTGFLGALAFVIAIVIGAKLAWNIVKSPRNHPWYGFGIGIVFACFVTLLVGIVESAPIGVLWVRPDTYNYIVSPAPWVLGGLLVSAHRLIYERAP